MKNWEILKQNKVNNASDILSYFFKENGLPIDASIDLEQLAYWLEIEIKTIPHFHTSGNITCNKNDIILNINLSANETNRRFTIAYLIGHLFLSTDLNDLPSPDSKENEERLIFATQLLIPLNWLINRQTQIKWLPILATTFNVSETVLKTRMRNLGLI